MFGLVLSHYSMAYISLTELEVEEATFTEELKAKTERLEAIKRQKTDIQKNIKALDSKLLPLTIEMKKLNLDYKKISVKKIEDRQQSEITQLSKIKYRQHILQLKINVEQKVKTDLENKIVTLNDRENRLQLVVKKLQRQLSGVQNQIAEAKNTTDSQQLSSKQNVATASVTLTVKPNNKLQNTKANTAPTLTVTPPVSVKTKTSGTAEQTKAVANTKNVTQQKTLNATKKAVTTQVKQQPLSATTVAITAEEMAKRKKSLRFLLQLNNIPEASKAVIRAKYKALENLQAAPKLGDHPEIQLSYLHEQNKATTEVNTLNHLGNNQYMTILTIESGFQHFHIGALKFTKRIDNIFNGKKAVVIIDAIDFDNPVFEVYPVSTERPDHFIY